MTPNEIVTVGTLEQMLAPLMQEIKRLNGVAHNASNRYLTIDEAAEYTGYSTKSVRNWIKIGKADKGGRKVKLKASEFTPGNYRISKQDLDAFGRLGLD